MYCDFVLDDQIKFNSYLNYYFDNKTIFNQTKKNYNKESILGAKKIINYLKKKKKTKKKTKKIIIKGFYTSDRNEVVQKIKLIISKNKFLNDNMLYFLVHGSYASNDYIPQWSDIDTFVVFKNCVFENQKKIIKLRKEISKLYLYFYEICRFQHHGLILFTERDLMEYADSFLPIQALSTCVSIIGKKTLEVNIYKNKTNLGLKKLEKRLIDFELTPKIGFYKHHPKNSVYLKYPIQKNSAQMFQLHVVINFVISFPIYFMSAINKPINKKQSFKKFYKIINNSRVKNVIENSRFIRRNWQIINNNQIPPWVLKSLGKHYFGEIIYSLKCIILNIKKYNFKYKKKVKCIKFTKI